MRQIFVRNLKVAAHFVILEPPCEMYFENRLALGKRRQIDEEDFVKAPFAHHLGRQRVDVVRRRDDEDKALFLLHPRQKRAKNARRGAAVVRAPDASKALLDFVNPEDARRHGLGRLDGVAHVFLAAAHEPAENLADVEPQQRHLPRCADGFCRQALAAARHACDEDAFRHGQAVARRPPLP